MLKLDSRRADKIKSILASVIMEGPSKQVTFAFICDEWEDIHYAKAKGRKVPAKGKMEQV